MKDKSLENLVGVGPTTKSRLKRLGINTIDDLLHHYPFRYEDFSKNKSIAELRDGDEVTIRGTIELIANKKSAKKHMVITEAVVSDETDSLRVVWFRQPFITKILQGGDKIYLSGKITRDYFGTQMKNPLYEKEKEQNDNNRIIPIYSLTAGLTQKQLRNMMKQVVAMSEDIVDWLPHDIRKRASVIGIREARREIHFPENQDSLTKAQNRIKFDELFILQLRAMLVRQSILLSTAPHITFHESETRKFVDSLGFILTKAQKIATWEILQDLAKSSPMNRLLEGDVGSGKTVVAGIAMYNATLSGSQSVLMSPTEILARQHFISMKRLFADTAVRICLLTREQVIYTDELSVTKSKKSQKEKLKKIISEGGVDIVIGTHAVLTDDTRFSRLGFIVVDEQHRFGVKQRQTIKEKSGQNELTPHFLSMSATPIPRTFALTLYGDLDLSIIDELPVGRIPVKTKFVEENEREATYTLIRDEVKRGRQVFVVCPRIDDDKSVDDKKTVLAEYEKLNNRIFSDLEVAMLHGKMKSQDKEEVMRRFVTGEIDILIATSVIEVGVDIPNATVMMIEDAERFGLAQLHQFRGRVGRSHHQSYCLLFSNSNSETVMDRLNYFTAHTSGFEVAEYDLLTRGPGQVYGVEQSGMMNFRLASMSDTDLIKKAREIARDVDLERYPSLREEISKWENDVHLE